MLTERPLDAELKGIITMRYSETLVKTCTAIVLGLPAHSGGERTARVRTGGGLRGTEEQGVRVRRGQDIDFWRNL